MTIVRLSAAHLDRVAAMEKTDGDMRWTRAQFEKELALAMSRFFVAEENDVTGYGGYWKVEDEAQITNLVVSLARRRAGIATQLLAALLSSAQTEGCRRATLDVRVSNHAAQALYRNAGFKDSGRRPNFYTDPTEDAVLMEKTLPADSIPLP